MPLDRSGRQLAVYDPKTKQTAMIDTCFGTHHLLFAEDADNTLWTSSGGGGGVVGWLNTKMWDRTHDAAKSQGWTALVLDTNGNGKRDAYVESEQKVLTAPSGESLGTSSASTHRQTHTRIHVSTRRSTALAIGTDGMIWGSVLGFPGGIVRIESGIEPARNRALRNTTKCRGTIRRRRYGDIRRAAWISTGTMSRGSRWEAAIWPALTGASAKVRSRVPLPLASTVRKAGHCIPPLARISRT